MKWSQSFLYIIVIVIYFLINLSASLLIGCRYWHAEALSPANICQNLLLAKLDVYEDV